MLKIVKVTTEKGFNLGRKHIMNGDIIKFNINEIYKLLGTRYVKNLIELNEDHTKSIKITLQNYKIETDWSKIPSKEDTKKIIEEAAASIDDIIKVDNIKEEKLEYGVTPEAEPIKPEQEPTKSEEVVEQVEDDVEEVEMGYDPEDGIIPTEEELAQAEIEINKK